MDRITIPHDPGPRKSYVLPMPGWGRDGRGHLSVRCRCALCITLDAGHAIGATGDITPAIHHDEADGGCGYHVWARLAAYSRASGERP